MAEPAGAKPLDAIVIGSGFAGAVTACRLIEAEQDVCVLERGRKYGEADLPVYPSAELSKLFSPDAAGQPRDRVQPDLSRAFWQLGHGLWDVRDLGDIVVTQAAGWGGGSLIYANVHLRAEPEVFQQDWPEGYDRDALDGYYDLVAYMLDVKPIPEPLPKTRRMQQAARELGREGQFFQPPLAVNFERRLVDNERFPREQGECDMRGDCCFGCEGQAKNSLDLNYLAFVEDAGADIRRLSEVEWIEGPGLQERPVYRVHYRDLLSGEEKDVTAHAVFVCAGAVNTTELLLRSREAEKLRFTGRGLGTRYHPNLDTLGVAFDCDDLFEGDRGPTITSALLHEREPNDGDPAARWTLPFRYGRREPQPGMTVKGERSSASGILSAAAIVRSGSWEQADSAGKLVLRSVAGSFQAGEPLQTEGDRFAKAAAMETKSKHWLLLEDGGLPSELEPLLGIFRSPLWLSRNRFLEREEPAPSAPGSISRLAELPFESLADAVSGLTPTAIQPRLPFFHEVGEAFLAASHVSQQDLTSEIVPKQLLEAVRKNRRDFLDEVAAVGEGVVSDFLDEAADKAEARINVEGRIPKELLPDGVDIDGIGDARLGRRLLRLAVQLVWGSQGDLARTIAERALSFLAPNSGQLLNGVSDVLRWALDYRLSDGRTALMLSMGRDSLPGTLSIDSPFAPAPGHTISGKRSGATAILVRCERRAGSWALGDAAGTLVLAKLTGTFAAGEPLRAGERTLGESQGPEVAFPVRDGPGTPDPLFAQLDLCMLDFAPMPRTNATRLPETKLRARLPDALETPERAAQEQLMRDVSKEWGAELRTDPIWAFLRRRVTVHSQGGCPMANSSAEGFTDADGQVFGCPGLYVMDAAAFPTSVGVNPSATILAIAERNVERFIQEDRPDWRARQFDNAWRWAEERRAELDPIPTLSRPVPPTRQQPIGITFKEVMLGHHGQDKRTAKSNIKTKLDAEIKDLTRFLAYQERGQPYDIEVSGKVTIDGLPQIPATELDLLAGQSHIRLFTDLGIREGQQVRGLDYCLVFAAGGNEYVLDGRKTIRDDERFDLWEDATTLDFKLLENGQKIREGVLRLPASEFFVEQLPSFHVTNTDDTARQAWALGAFAKFFFGHMVDIYVPEIDKVVDVVKSVVGRTHV